MSVAEEAKRVYDQEFRTKFEAEHWGAFVAIEPVSKASFIGDSFIEVAKAAHPDRPSIVMRIGQDAAFHLGAGTM